MQIKNLKSKIKNSGFTLIELLIVIALLGTLAVGLLATIDPFEQLKKGRDTSTRNMVEEFYNGALRYYAIKNSFPWGNTAQEAAALSPDLMAELSMIQSAGELKEAFLDASGLEEVIVSSGSCTGGACEDLSVCFQPQSKAFRNDNNSKYNASGVSAFTPDPACTSCYWCIR